MSTPSADVSVRVAWVDDAPSIAALQRRTWLASYAGVVPRQLLEFDVEAAAQAWRASLARPGDARNRVLVALDGQQVVGFVVTVPASDPDCDPVADGEVVELTVAPDQRGRGHGSRLLQAAVDTLVADRFRRAVTWVVAGDDRLRRFLAEAGWAPDSAHRSLDLDGSGATVVQQVRLHCAIG